MTMIATITVQLTAEQIRQATEGLGQRIESMRKHAEDYAPEEIEAALLALDVLMAARWPLP